MTSTPRVEPAAGASARPPLRQRGFIASYGVGRVCADEACETALSRYNDSELCYPHADELAARRLRERA
jgi:hypothetical protein